MVDDDAPRPADDAAPPPRDDAARLAAWRAEGAHRLDPVRFTFLDALARRAAGLQGPARQLLDEKLAKGLASYGAQVAAHASATGTSAPPAPRDGRPAADARTSPSTRTTTTPAPQQARARGPLADVADLLGHAAVPDPGSSAAGSDAPAPASPASLLSTAPPDLKTLSYFRSTWTRLKADQRLTHALEQVPQNAGPLNSQHLVHRALATMRDTSPAYLQRFVAYVDALLWVDQVHGQAFVMPSRDDKPEPAKKGTRRRTG